MGKPFFFFFKDTKRWRVEENSIIMPDVPNFAKQHFEHFQRSNGHRSTGETLLYQAVPVGKPEFPVVFRTSKQTFKCPTSKILQQRNNSPAENYDNRSTLRPSWSLFHKLRCRKVPMSFLLKVFSCLSFVRPWPCTWFHVMRFCILCNICTLGLDRWMMGCSWS